MGQAHSSGFCESIALDQSPPVQLVPASSISATIDEIFSTYASTLCTLRWSLKVLNQRLYSWHHITSVHCMHVQSLLPHSDCSTHEQQSFLVGKERAAILPSKSNSHSECCFILEPWFRTVITSLRAFMNAKLKTHLILKLEIG